MLINMNEMLKVAKENKFGVPAFNIGSEVMLRSVMETCEATNSPVILAIHPDELDFFGDDFAKMVVSVAKASKVPAVVHLDHGETIPQVLRAISCGFSSVMIDASRSSLDENINLSRKVVDLCKPLNISVEGELGTIGNNDGTFEGVSADIIYTNPDDAKKYVIESGVDTLAVAIGTAHGIYPKSMKPELRLDILKDITNELTIPLVLHGGSNNKDEEIKSAVAIGIQKVNISSDYKSALYRKCREILNENPCFMEPNQIYPECIVAAKEVIEFKLHLLNTYGKASLYYK